MPDDPDKNPSHAGAAPPETFGEAIPSCGDFDIRIGRDGTWHYRGSPIGRQAVVRLFASVLRRDDAGRYWLVTPVERGLVEVEDAPFLAVEVEAIGEGEAQILGFRTNLDHWVAAGPDRPLFLREPAGGGDPRPYICLDGGLEALVARPVFYQLVDLAVARPTVDENKLGVWSRGCFFPLEP